ncbi:MAG TPA: DUF1573 domain-containing protein [Chryseolinea sp.]
MKKNLFMIILLAVAAQGFVLQASAQTAAANGPVITFEKKSVDFGDMVQGDKVQHVWKFTNTGNEPLIITNVQVTCGCTTGGWPRDPIAPGGKGEIPVSFNSAGKMGKQNKVVTIVSNAVNTDGAQISFTANVVEKKVNPQ